MDQGQKGAQSSRQAGSQFKQGNGSSNQPASIWPPHTHKEEMNNGLNAFNWVMLLFPDDSDGFPSARNSFCLDSRHTNLYAHSAATQQHKK